MSKVGVVYVLESNGIVKIGHTSNFNQRFSMLKCSSPDLKTLFLSENLENRQDVEKDIHHKLSEYRYKGEWFKCDSNFAINVCNESIKTIGKFKEGEFDMYKFEEKLSNARATANGFLCNALYKQNKDMITEYIRFLELTKEETDNFLKLDKGSQILKAMELLSRLWIHSNKKGFD